ncbi:hypothetical protein HaLaN_01050 [Haematococcus lacustris]|uniref:DUF659 domain-containing protein n=1 Tax=Haematococcus lacustris TaxID=44745 RepID=A0A699Y8M6_HAELA|nr:hypothetical protein HaLaN_01050 [Haematococcus lacustris]
MQQPSMPTVQQISGGMRPSSALNSASSSKRPFFHSQFGPIFDGKRQCLHCPAQFAWWSRQRSKPMSDHMLLEEYAAVKAEVTCRLAAVPFVAIIVDGWSQKQDLVALARIKAYVDAARDMGGPQ